MPKNESCGICKKELLLYKCKYCGKSYCVDHRAPEKHECQGMSEYRKQMAMGTMAKPGVSKVEGSSYKGRRSVLPPTWKNNLVLGVKVLSVLLVAVAAVFVLIFLIGYIDSQMPVVSFKIPVSNATGEGVVLVNYKNASDPAYDDLIRFLKADPTSDRPYQYPSFTCADFARALHDNAEAAGIRAGLISIDFYDAAINYSVYDDGSGNFSLPGRASDVGHGLNVFNTTDRGAVFVDASSSLGASGDGAGDRIAFVVEGKELNEIALDFVQSTDYGFYETYKQRYLDYLDELRDYNRDVIAYNAERDSCGIDAPYYKIEELNRRAKDLSSRKAELEARVAQLGPFCYPPGIVKKVSVYW